MKTGPSWFPILFMVLGIYWIYYGVIRIVRKQRIPIQNRKDITVSPWVAVGMGIAAILGGVLMWNGLINYAR